MWHILKAQGQNWTQTVCFEDRHLSGSHDLTPELTDALCVFMSVWCVCVIIMLYMKSEPSEYHPRMCSYSLLQTFRENKPATSPNETKSWTRFSLPGITESTLCLYNWNRSAVSGLSEETVWEKTSPQVSTKKKTTPTRKKQKQNKKNKKKTGNRNRKRWEREEEED